MPTFFFIVLFMNPCSLSLTLHVALTLICLVLDQCALTRCYTHADTDDDDDDVLGKKGNNVKNVLEITVFRHQTQAVPKKVQLCPKLHPGGRNAKVSLTV